MTGKLKEKLENGTLTLARTQNWLRESIKKLGPPPTVVTMNKISHEEILVRAMLDLVVDADDLLTLPSTIMSNKKELTPATTPETLLMDVDRLRTYQTEFTYAVSFTSSILRINHIIGQVNAANTKRLSDILSTQSIPDIDQAINMIFQNDDDVKEEEIKKKIQQALDSSSDRNDSVFKLM